MIFILALVLFFIFNIEIEFNNIKQLNIMKNIKQFKEQELSKPSLKKVRGGQQGVPAHGSGRLYYEFDGCYYTITAVEYFA